ncbi:MAG: peptide chain release factor N(5)-glutamine methyltransferase [Gordonia sp. (in: high G+C Gram-positive bacteria)]|uniref:peptide chain release factor N(5)-glutamine methyltransferase n=1 Tax=Gordonia sp. (in: high G+C Gram-positive bacteria) TaxID=84139 RepID=UPI0039E4E2A4
MTASQLRDAGAARLAAAGIDSAASDAAWLLAHVLGTEPGRLPLIDDVDADDRAAYDRLITARAQRIPLQHLTEQTDFAGVELAVGPGVFIPRPETELLVEWAEKVAATLPADRPVRVADLCAGSGALGIALAVRVPRARVTLVEKSTRAVEFIDRNIAALPEPVTRRLSLIVGDVTDPAVIGELGECDVIVSNPPYVPEGTPVPPEVDQDPAEAVFSGPTGMDVITAMVPLIADALAPGGAVAVEHDDTTAAQTVAVFAADGRFTDVTALSDLAGRPRFVTAVRRR